MAGRYPPRSIPASIPYALPVPAVADDAVCIRHWDWSETSQTISLFTRTHGLIRGIAKGSKREKAPFSGGVELLTRGQAMFILRPSADLVNITAWDLQELFPAARASLSTFYSAMYLADLVQHALHDRDPHPALYGHFLRNLRALGSPDANARAVLDFQWATLVECGYKPELDHDIASGSALAQARTYAFSPRLGGFTADHGSPDGGPAWRVRSETLEILRALGRGEQPAPPPSTTDRAARLLAAYFREILGRELPSAASLFGELAV